MALLDLPLVAPDRKTSGFRPFKVLHHFGKLVEDKEDTEQVFHIIEATKGKASHRQAHAFIRSDEGQRFMREGVDIPAMLDDLFDGKVQRSTSVLRDAVRYLLNCQTSFEL